ncbi:MAG: universal stress protein [Wenzhouxiangella sp.]|nr:MAG: universal stress protein [Wenzhouxiangella sp.]
MEHIVETMTNQAKEIVVAVDGSENGLRALRAAADLADATGRDLALLYVYPYGRADQRPAELAAVSESSFESHKESVSRAVFEAAIAELGSRRRPLKRYLLVGDPASEIISFMAENPATHLVLGRRGLSKFKALIMGSVTQKVTRHANGLVTVVT